MATHSSKRYSSRDPSGFGTDGGEGGLKGTRAHPGQSSTQPRDGALRHNRAETNARNHNLQRSSTYSLGQPTSSAQRVSSDSGIPVTAESHRTCSARVFCLTLSSRCALDADSLLRSRPWCQGSKTQKSQTQQTRHFHVSRLYLKTKLQTLSPHHRFVIAWHPPKGVAETGLRICPAEKKGAKARSRVESDTFSGPV